MSISRFLCVASLIVSTAAGCATGGNCDPCDSNEDCDPDKVCAEFTDGERQCADEDTGYCTETTYY